MKKDIDEIKLLLLYILKAILYPEKTREHIKENENLKAVIEKVILDIKDDNLNF